MGSVLNHGGMLICVFEVHGNALPVLEFVAFVALNLAAYAFGVVWAWNALLLFLIFEAIWKS